VEAVVQEMTHHQVLEMVVLVVVKLIFKVQD
jgi:hypothetical protein